MYITVNFYDETAVPGEIFIVLAKQGSTLGGFADMLACTASIALQHGVPWREVRRMWLHTKFEPMDEQGRSIPELAAARIDGMIKEEEEKWK
jgi:ribonucleoside-diphosphate reductase alpha chain